MICEDVESELEAWSVGLLDRDGRRDVETHLAYCGGCAEQAASLRRIVAVLSAGPASAGSAGLEDRILARALGVPRRPVRRTLASAAAVAIAALFIPWEPAPRPALVAVPPAVARSVVEAPAPAPPPDVERAVEPPLPELDVPPDAPTEAVASFSWEEAADVPLLAEEGNRVALTLWGVDLEARETFDPGGRDVEGASLSAGTGNPRAFVGWSRDEAGDGAALIGLSLGF